MEKKEITPITERVKTFEDAIEVLGKNHIYARQYINTVDELRAMEIDDESKDLVAYLKLRIIAEALNEGWKPKLTEGEWRFTPTFLLYPEEEWQSFDDDQKLAIDHFDWGCTELGMECTGRIEFPSNVAVNITSRLYFKTDELAKYAGKQFTDIYFDYLIK